MSEFGQNISGFFGGGGSGGGGGTVTSVGLSAPSAFTVTSSPVTGSGTLTFIGAGTVNDYIRGNGSLAAFPTIPTVTNANGTYSGSIGFTAGTAPSGATSHFYSYTQVGNTVNILLSLVYAVQGATVTAVTASLPSSFPQPVLPTGVSGALAMVAPASGQVSGTFTIGINQTRPLIRRNAADNGFEFYWQQTGGSYRYFIFTGTYFTA